MNKNFKVYVNEILDSISEIEEFTKNLTFEGFLGNKMAIKAVSMNLLLIGENVRLVPASIKKEYRQIPWAKMKSVRNFIAHEYPKVDIRDLWDTAKSELPPIKEMLQKVIDEE